MEKAEMITPGEFLWIVNEYGCLRMIIAEHIYWDNEPELEGWNILCGEEEYYLECCYKLEHPFVAN